MRRLFDITVAAVALVLLGPVLLAIHVMIRATMGGPALFRQTRSGLHGRDFEILKFRTMLDQRYPDEPDATRITRVGQLLRTTSLDELPQLINVLRGDMGIIGPRPTLPSQVVHYSPRQRGRLDVRPGLTGWAQVQGRNALSWPVRIEYDLWYVRNRGARLDLVILWRTVGVLLRPSGITAAGGVNPGFPVPASAETGTSAEAKQQPRPAPVRTPRTDAFPLPRPIVWSGPITHSPVDPTRLLPPQRHAGDSLAEEVS
ncbi:sugar transferase [Embleya hyalina]|uniref:Sugar transferase n=1 Tax=Embleya hyalina TaxID=516124 RepID=A0A401YXD7_9ACTN|nr:sugar transferase [Embleya hyalina]GCD99284.1 sugar transferase [Embleya hyalina]